jgi:tyrosinase
VAGSMVYRVRVSAENESSLAKFRDAMKQLQAISDNRGYNHIAGFHGVPGQWCWHHQISPRTPVQARLFLPWHRAYLWYLEQAAQDRVQGASLPWWDWTTERSIPPAYTVASVGGAPNPLRRFRMQVSQANPPLNRYTRRAPGANPQSRLPTTAEIDDLLTDTDWTSFSDRLESFHDDVHVWVGGDMGSVSTAGFDPVFYAHHCMIDRVWYLWQVRHGNGGVPKALLDLPLPPFNKTFTDVLDTQALGYEYATSVTEVPIA